MDFFEDISAFILRRCSVQRRIAGEPAPVDKPHSAQRTKDKRKIYLKTENSTCPVSRWASNRQSSNKQKEKRKKARTTSISIYILYTHMLFKGRGAYGFYHTGQMRVKLEDQGKMQWKKKEVLLVPLVDFLSLSLFPFLLSPSFSKRRTFCGHRGFHALSETDKSFTPKGPKDQTFLFLNRNIWY